uniref:Flagellar protein FlbD n=1 Tax=uncultured Armatimonadetes bacterium TaxID=157466 RepID=A0A6J4J9I2_9BACT|nr:Flagellar protein FlbD [uncultured Armatimonadetes bacterium]
MRRETSLTLIPRPSSLIPHTMIQITRLGGQEVWVNADLIEFVETTPDTIITLTTGKKVLVRESADEVTGRVLAFRRAAGARPFAAGRHALAPGTAESLGPGEP